MSLSKIKPYSSPMMDTTNDNDASLNNNDVGMNTNITINTSTISNDNDTSVSSSTSPLSPFAFNANVTSRRRGGAADETNENLSSSISRRKLLDESPITASSISKESSKSFMVMTEEKSEKSLSYSLSPFQSPLQRHAKKQDSLNRRNRTPLSPLTNNATSRNIDSEKRLSMSLSKRLKRMNSSGTTSSMDDDIPSLKKKRRTSEIIMKTLEEENTSASEAVSNVQVSSNTTGSKSQLPFDKITLPFPSTDKDNILNPKALRKAYNHALENGFHQRELKESGCNLLSLDEVIIPTIISSKLQSLRTMIGKARGRGDDDEVNQLQFMRSILMSININVSHEMTKYRLGMKKVREEQRVEEKERLIVEKSEEKKLKAEEKIQEQIIERERRRKERKKNYPRNKELWREVMVLMTDLSRLEKEEKMWKAIDIQSLIRNSNDIIPSVPASKDVETLVDDGEKVADHAHEVEQKVKDAVDDVTLATNRINDALSSICVLIKESNDIRVEMNERYKNDHKFHGYLGINDPKALIRGLTLAKW